MGSVKHFVMITNYLFRGEPNKAQKKIIDRICFLQENNCYFLTGLLSIDDFKTLGQKYTAEDVLNMVAEYTGISVKSIKLKSRQDAEIAFARHVFYYLVIRQLKIKITTTCLGKLINQDHSSVVYGCKMVEDTKAKKQLANKIIDFYKLE